MLPINYFDYILYIYIYMEREREKEREREPKSLKAFWRQQEIRNTCKSIIHNKKYLYKPIHFKIFPFFSLWTNKKEKLYIYVLDLA